jgi:hypothetical protein
MKIADKEIIFDLEKRINKLADSVQGLAEITDETLNTTVELTKHIVSLQEDFITVINRLNEVELSMEEGVTTKELFVSPAEDFSGEVDTPYPGKTKPRYRRSSKIQRVVTNLKRLIRNHATP